ncbi:hypothetical protein HA402_001897 [Bradysia odoriphaga]|nr:hypothetical protein HA402_001897 [Bradysia odoriphaga]
MDENKLLEQKKRLEDKLKKLCPKTESEYKKDVMKLLEEYNAVKDAVQTLIGGLATIENGTVKEIHERLNLHSED